MHLIFTILIRSIMCLAPCVTYMDPFFKSMRDDGPDTMSLWVFDGRPEVFRDAQRAGFSMY